MTQETLNSVRDLQKKIRNLERRVQSSRMSVENIVPVLDGLPHSSEIKSRVEKLALMIVEGERELENLRGQLVTAKANLAARILCEVDDPPLQTLLVLRYVGCLSFKETARRMRFTLRHVYRLHEKFLRNVTHMSS